MGSDSDSQIQHSPPGDNLPADRLPAAGAPSTLASDLAQQPQRRPGGLPAGGGNGGGGSPLPVFRAVQQPRTKLDMATTLGIDIGGTSVKAAVHESGRFTRVGQSPFYARPSIDELLKAIREAAGPVGDLNSVGLCVPGLLDANRRTVTFAVNVPGLVGVPLDQLVPRALDHGAASTRVAAVSNDAAAAAHDIFLARRLRGRLLVLTLGTGVGAAVLDDGELLHVDGDSPGHIGQIDVSVPDAEVIGPDGGAGGLEGYIGVAALRQKYGPDPSAAVARFTGDEPAVRALVHALRICHAIYRPHHICLCGGIGIRLRHLLPLIRLRCGERLTSLAQPGWTLDCGIDDFHAARGAARLAATTAAAEDAARDGERTNLVMSGDEPQRY